MKPFYMDEAHPLSTPMVVWSPNVEKDSFLPKEDVEAILILEVPYLCAIGALTYLTNCTQLGIHIFSLSISKM